MSEAPVPGTPVAAAHSRPRYRMVVAITTCPKNADRMQAVRDTWLGAPLPPDVLAFFVMGRPGQAASLEGDILYLDCPESYERLPVKTWRLLEYCLHHFDFGHLFKCDDDNYVSLPHLLAYPCEGVDYIGRFYRRLTRTWHFGKVADPSLNVAYGGPNPQCRFAAGSGYFLSQQAAGLVLERVTLAHAYEELYEDVMVGVALRPTRKDRVRTGFRVRGLRLGYRRHILHPVSPERMRLIHARRTRWGSAQRRVRGLLRGVTAQG